MFSLTCVPFDFKKHLSLCLQCIEQGFSHIHVLLKMQYLIQVTESLFFQKMKIKKPQIKLYAALLEVSDKRTERLSFPVIVDKLHNLSLCL